MTNPNNGIPQPNNGFYGGPQPGNEHPPFFDGTQGVNSPASSGGYYENSPAVAHLGMQANPYAPGNPYVPGDSFPHANPYGHPQYGYPQAPLPGYQSEQKKKSSLPLIIIAVTALVVLAAAGGAFFYFTSGSSHHDSAGGTHSSNSTSGPVTPGTLPENSDFNPCTVSPQTLSSAGFNDMHKSEFTENFGSIFGKNTGIRVKKVCFYTANISLDSDGGIGADMGEALVIGQDSFDPAEREEKMKTFHEKLQGIMKKTVDLQARLVNFSHGSMLIASGMRAMMLGDYATGLSYGSNGRLVSFAIPTKSPRYQEKYSNPASIEKAIIDLNLHLK